MSAVQPPLEIRFEAMTPQTLDGVLAVEKQAYAHPWVLANFTDALASGYQAQLLMAGDMLLGYFVAMKGVDEVHLLNITVAPDYQRQGWAHVMLDALALWARGQGAEWLWLEVRSHARQRQRTPLGRLRQRWLRPLLSVWLCMRCRSGGGCPGRNQPVPPWRGRPVSTPTPTLLRVRWRGWTGRA
jgi:ribosomal-protein-alanine N-acetyltransferase